MDYAEIGSLAKELLNATEQQDEGEARRIIGALMGKATSDRKAAASRENAKLGGRRKGFAHSDATRTKIAESNKRRWAERQQGETNAD